MEKKLSISCTCHCGDALVAEAPDFKNPSLFFHMDVQAVAELKAVSDFDEPRRCRG